jgi:hypothetical protein
MLLKAEARLACSAWSFVEQPVVDRFEGDWLATSNPDDGTSSTASCERNRSLRARRSWSSAAFDFSAPSYFGACSVTP